MKKKGFPMKRNILLLTALTLSANFVSIQALRVKSPCHWNHIKKDDGTRLYAKMCPNSHTGLNEHAYISLQELQEEDNRHKLYEQKQQEIFEQLKEDKANGVGNYQEGMMSLDPYERSQQLARKELEEGN
jgi:hypothetical protein